MAYYNSAILGNQTGYQGLLNSYTGFYESSTANTGNFFNVKTNNISEQTTGHGVTLLNTLNTLDIIPSTNGVSDLGSTSKRWKDIHLSGIMDVPSIQLSNTTNQILLGTTNTVTINSVAPAASRTYTIPDTGANSSFVMTDGNQGIGGQKDFSSGTVLLSDIGQNNKDTNFVVDTSNSWALNFYGNDQLAPVCRIMGFSFDNADPDDTRFLFLESVSIANTRFTGTTPFDCLFMLPRPSSNLFIGDASSSTPYMQLNNQVISLPKTTNQLSFGTTNTVTINSIAPTASRTHTIPDIVNSDFVLTNGSQTLDNKTLTNAISIDSDFVTSTDITSINSINSPGIVSALTMSLTSTGISGGLVQVNTTTAGPMEFQINKNSLTNWSFAVPSASNQFITTSASNDLCITSTTSTANSVLFGTGAFQFMTIGLNQTHIFPTTTSSSSSTGCLVLEGGCGIKDNLTVANNASLKNVTIRDTSNQLVLGTTNTVTISSTAPAASRTYTIPDTAANSNFIMSDLAQTINGVKTFTSALTGPSATLTNTTNQLVLGTTNTTTISSVAPASSRTYTIPDAGTNANFVMSELAQTINGAKTLSGITTISNTTDSSSGTTGSIVTTGGIGVAKSVFIGATLILPNTGYGSTIGLGDYYFETFSSTMGGAWNGLGISLTCKICRMGVVVYFKIPQQLTVASATNNIVFLAILPSYYRPATQLDTPNIVSNVGAVFTSGAVRVPTGATGITIYSTSAYNNFTNGVQAGFLGTVVTWMTV